jgi:3-oxoacyl-[acyl-carrier-protein] synthase-3
MQTRPVKILGTGIHLPKCVVTDAEIDQRANLAPGWTRKHSGVLQRHFVTDETAAGMGAGAVNDALANAGLTLNDVDCLVCTSGTMAQPIPCTAALICEELKPRHNLPAFDINATCLSFLTGLDTMSYLVTSGRYRCVVLVATEIASFGLNWQDAETCSIFGDGAAAVVIRASEQTESSRILAARMETFPRGAHLAEIRGGGSRLHAKHFPANNRADYLFHMEGKGIFKIAAETLPAFVERLLADAGLGWPDFQIVIPHQASLMALHLTQRRLGIPEEKFFIFAERVGNTIAASLPMGLHLAVQNGRLRRGDKTLLLGTSAGFSVGGLILEY